MKWFKHMTDTRRREDIAKLLNERSGTMLYGIYCLILETVAENMDGYSDCCEVTYPIKEWAEIAHVDVRTFTRSLHELCKLADFMYSENDKLVTVRIDNLLKLQDERTRKVRTKMGKQSGLDIEKTGLDANASRPTPPEHSLRSCSPPIGGERTNPEIFPSEATNTKEDNHSSSPSPKARKRSTRFLKPTLEDVATYCKERKNTINPQAFIDHYESNGWKVGRTKMKNWKAAVHTWESNQYDDGNTAKNNGRTGNGGVTADYAENFRPDANTGLTEKINKGETT